MGKYWKYPQRETVAFLCFGGFYDPLPTGIGFGIGWPKGGPSVAQGPPKRRPREAQATIWGNVFVCNKNKKMAGGVVLAGLRVRQRDVKIAAIARHRRNRRNRQTIQKGHEGTRRRRRKSS